MKLKKMKLRNDASFLHNQNWN